jgi:hypothetical protein
MIEYNTGKSTRSGKHSHRGSDCNHQERDSQYKSVKNQNRNVVC